MAVRPPAASSSAAPAPPPRAPVLSPRLPADTVALGDSYASGVAAPPYDAGTDLPGQDTCSRSARSWPRLLGVQATRHLACSGAVVDDLTTSRQALVPPDATPQLARLGAARRALRRSGRDVAAVTVMVGGNDIGFGSVLTQCYLGTCLARPRTERTVVEALVPRLTAVLLQVRAAAPAARVWLVGYPRLFPRRQSQVHGCTWLSNAERSHANEVSGALDAAQARAARASGATFLPTSGALSGHELCSGSGTWLVPFDPLTYGGYQGQAHPTASGQQALARAVSAGLRSHAG